jgi:hypothetical protein
VSPKPCGVPGKNLASCSRSAGLGVVANAGTGARRGDAGLMESRSRSITGWVSLRANKSAHSSTPGNIYDSKAPADVVRRAVLRGARSRAPCAGVATGTRSTRYVGPQNNGDNGERIDFVSVHPEPAGKPRTARRIEWLVEASEWVPFALELVGQVSRCHSQVLIVLRRYSCPKTMSVREQFADSGGPSVGFGAIRRSQKRAATHTGLT